MNKYFIYSLLIIIIIIIIIYLLCKCNIIENITIGATSSIIEGEENAKLTGEMMKIGINLQDDNQDIKNYNGLNNLQTAFGTKAFVPPSYINTFNYRGADLSTGKWPQEIHQSKNISIIDNFITMDSLDRFKEYLGINRADMLNILNNPTSNLDETFWTNRDRSKYENEIYFNELIENIYKKWKENQDNEGPLSKLKELYTSIITLYYLQLEALNLFGSWKFKDINLEDITRKYSHIQGKVHYTDETADWLRNQWEGGAEEPLEKISKELNEYDRASPLGLRFYNADPKGLLKEISIPISRHSERDWGAVGVLAESGDFLTEEQQAALEGLNIDWEILKIHHAFSGDSVNTADMAAGDHAGDPAFVPKHLKDSLLKVIFFQDSLNYDFDQPALMRAGVPGLPEGKIQERLTKLRVMQVPGYEKYTNNKQKDYINKAVDAYLMKVVDGKGPMLYDPILYEIFNLPPAINIFNPLLNERRYGLVGVSVGEPVLFDGKIIETEEPENLHTYKHLLSGFKPITNRITNKLTHPLELIIYRAFINKLIDMDEFVDEAGDGSANLPAEFASFRDLSDDSGPPINKITFNNAWNNVIVYGKDIGYTVTTGTNNYIDFYDRFNISNNQSKIIQAMQGFTDTLPTDLDIMYIWDPTKLNLFGCNPNISIDGAKKIDPGTVQLNTQCMPLTESIYTNVIDPYGYVNNLLDDLMNKYDQIVSIYKIILKDSMLKYLMQPEMKDVLREDPEIEGVTSNNINLANALFVSMYGFYTQLVKGDTEYLGKDTPGNESQLSNVLVDTINKLLPDKQYDSNDKVWHILYTLIRELNNIETQILSIITASNDDSDNPILPLNNYNCKYYKYINDKESYGQQDSLITGILSDTIESVGEGGGHLLEGIGHFGAVFQMKRIEEALGGNLKAMDLFEMYEYINKLIDRQGSNSLMLNEDGTYLDKNVDLITSDIKVAFNELQARKDPFNTNKIWILIYYASILILNNKFIKIIDYPVDDEDERVELAEALAFRVLRYDEGEDTVDWHEISSIYKAWLKGFKDICT